MQNELLSFILCNVVIEIWTEICVEFKLQTTSLHVDPIPMQTWYEATFPQLYMVRWGDLAGPSSWLFCDNFWTMICCCAAVKNSDFKIALETSVRSGSCWCVHLQIILYMEIFVQIFWSLQSNIKHKLNANITNILQLLKPLRILYNNHSCSNPCSSKKSWHPINNSTFLDNVCKLPKHSYSCHQTSQMTRICQEFPTQDMSI